MAERLSTPERTPERTINFGFLMSRGAGNVQRSLIAAFEGELGRPFTVEELAEIAFLGEVIERTHMVSVRRALRNLPGLKLNFQRTGESGTRGWRYLVRRTG
jgi:hypothetical protein